MKAPTTWNIKPEQLAGFKKNGWEGDFFKATQDQQYVVYIYNINEWRMLAYAGYFAIYQASNSEKPILNSGKTPVWFDSENTFDYAPLSECFLFRMPALHNSQPGRHFPFLVIKPSGRKFAFIHWDSTSVYYGFTEVGLDKLVVKEVHSESLTNLHIRKRTGETFNLATLTWYNLDLIDEAEKIYQLQLPKPWYKQLIKKLLS